MQSHFSNIVILIPAYQPNSALISFVQDLLSSGFVHLVVVDDGSGNPYRETFSQLSSFANVHLITHQENQGKGAALKTGFRFILEKYQENCIGVVTCDADGQHLVKDVVAVANGLQQNPHQLVLGERHFNKSVPFRSRFGNTLTQKLFGWMYHSNVQDTQTGLRGIPWELLSDYLQISYSRYEYELECLVMATERGFIIFPVPIETVYIDQNASSHFRPLVDSVKIYCVFFRYLIIALLSFAIDVALFVLLHWMTANIMFSLFVARVISSAFNFMQNKFIVYRCKDQGKLRQQMLQYAGLVVIVFCFAYLLLSIFHLDFGLGVITSKILADLILFCVSFIIQRCIVFKTSL